MGQIILLDNNREVTDLQSAVYFEYYETDESGEVLWRVYGEVDDDMRSSGIVSQTGSINVSE